MGSSWANFVPVAADLLGVPVLPGLAAVVAVLTGLFRFGGDLAKWRRKPRLQLTFDAKNQPVDAEMYWNEQYPRARLSMIRLDVSNVGRSRADEVLVQVTRVQVHRDGVVAQQREHQRLCKLPLAWANVDVRDRHAEGKRRDIAANASEQVDLVHVNEARPTELHLDTRPRLPNDPQWLKESAVTLELRLSAANDSTRHYEITVKLLEPWTDASAPAALSVTGPLSVEPHEP